MNKQEVLKNIEKLDGLTIKDKDFNFDIEMILKAETLEIIEQLDEPEKPVVPQFVADFYESIKDDFEDKVYEFCVQFNNNNEELNRDVWWWFGCNDNKPIETLVKMKLYGYEVKKEKLYVVFQVATKEYLYTNVFGELRSACVSREFVEESEEYHFTQQKLEGLNYWNNPAFEIEEVEK